MPKLLPTVQDVMGMAIGHEKFLLRNTGQTNDASVDHYVFNPQQILANNRHLKSISQMEGQPNGDATTEGQSLQILGYIYMYRGTKEQYWLDRAVAMWEAYVTHFYQGQPIPDEPGRWLSNWIINGKEPVLANWPIDFEAPTHSGFLGTEFTWTAGRTTIPAGAPHWGEYLDKATFAFRGALAWNTIVADVKAVLPDGTTDWNNAGTKFPVDWVIDYLGRKVDWDGNVLEASSPLPKGTVQLKDTTVTGVAKLCYANCQPVEHGGYLIARNEAWHNRPLRVPIPEKGNLGNAADAELWFCDACYQLWDITKEERYYKAWRSVQYMCMDYSNIDMYDKFFRQSTYDQSPWTDGISYDYSYPSDAVVTYGRDATGYITIALDKAAQHTMEQQSVAYQIDDAATIHVNVGGVDTAGAPLNVKVTMELADSKTSTTTTAWQINLPDTPVDGSVATYAIPMTSMSLADNPNGDYIIADNRVMSDWGNVTHAFHFEANVYDTRSAQICTSTVKDDDSGVIIGFWLTDSEKALPTEIVYRTDEQHTWILTIVDGDQWRWYWELPATRIWDHAVLDPKDLRLKSYQPDAGGRDLPLNPNLVAVDQISIAIDDMLGATAADFSWYCVNDIPPTFAGHTAWTNKFSITLKGEAAFNARLGDCDMVNPNYNPLAYTPGVIPFSNNATNGIVEFDGWRGLPYPGYQHPFIYVHENEPERLNNMVNFLYDSQQAYFTKFGVLGPGAAAYVWNRWDNIKYGTADTFTFYHWGSDHPWAGYQPRAFASAARAWHEMVVAGVTVPTKLIMYIENWTTWLIKYVEQYGSFPTDFPSDELPTPIEGDFTGHMTGLWLTGACFTALCGSPIAKLDWLIEMAVKELNDNYYVGDVSVMNGSWSPAIRTGDNDNTKNNSMFFGFWSGEILRGLGVYLMYRRGVPGEELDILERTLSNLTQVGSGGVVRPEVTLKEDLNAIEDTANTAKTTADETADFLETRVPEGRTINNLPLDQDLNLTPEVLNTYDRATIDAKIAAVVSGGYNPVHVNGYLLDRDIILTPGDLGTYTASEIDGKLGLRVPTTRTVNGKALSADVTLTAADVSAYSKSESDAANALLVPATRKINGVALTADVTLRPQDIGAPAAADVVPRSFTINGQAMTGTGLTISAGGDGYTKGEVDAKLATYLPVQNEFGLGIQPETLTAGSFGENVRGSGFYEYEAGTDDDGSGGTIPTAVSDRPTGSAKGRVIVLSNEATYDNNGAVTTPARQDAIAFPDDLDGLLYRKNGGAWSAFGGGGSSTPLPHTWIPMNDSAAMVTGDAPFDTLTVGGETLDLNSKSMNFSRSSTATYIGKDGLLKTAVVDEPRFERPGLLIEGPGTNNVANSVAAATWRATANVTAAAAAVNSPAGDTDGVTLISVSTAATAQFGTAIQVNPAILTQGGYCAFSAFVKAGTHSLVQLRWLGGGTGVSTDYANFDLTTGEVRATTNISYAKAIPMADGWFRLMAVTLVTGDLTGATSVDTGLDFINSLADARRPTIALAAGKNFYAYGPQVEAISSPSSYVPTTGTVATRAPDMASLIGQSNWGKGQATVLTEVQTNWNYAPNAAPRIFDLGTVTVDRDYVALQLSSATNRTLVGSAGNGQNGNTNYGKAVLAPDTHFVAGIRFDGSNQMDVILNGKPSDKLQLPYAISNSPGQVRIGGQTTSGQRHLYGHLRNFRIWQRALTNDQIKETL